MNDPSLSDFLNDRSFSKILFVYNTDVGVFVCELCVRVWSMSDVCANILYTLLDLTIVCKIALS